MLNLPDESEMLPLKDIEVVMTQKVPFNVLLGIQCDKMDRGFIRARVPFRKELVGDATRPAIHGGVMSSFADATCGAAVFTALRKGDTCSTIDLRVDYLRPGLEQDIVAEARVLRIGGQVGVAEARLFQDSGEDIAVAKGVFMIRRRQESDVDKTLMEDV